MRRPVDISTVISGYKGDRGRARALLKALKAQGYTFAKGGKHYVLIGPDGQSLGFSGSASDWRALKNLEQQLKKRGVSLPGHKVKSHA